MQIGVSIFRGRGQIRRLESRIDEGGIFVYFTQLQTAVSFVEVPLNDA